MEGKVAVWIGVSIEEENTIIGAYDHDKMEGGYSLPHFSYASSFANQVLEKAKEFVDNPEGYYFTVLYDSDPDLPVGEIDPTKYSGVSISGSINSLPFEIVEVDGEELTFQPKDLPVLNQMVTEGKISSDIAKTITESLEQKASSQEKVKGYYLGSFHYSKQ